jgi:hypothetical protein
MPQNDAERAFVRIVEDAKRQLFEGPDAMVPEHMRLEMLSRVTLNQSVTGEPICTLADPDYLLKFRAAAAKERH